MNDDTPYYVINGVIYEYDQVHYYDTAINIGDIVVDKIHQLYNNTRILVMFLPKQSRNILRTKRGNKIC